MMLRVSGSNLIFIFLFLLNCNIYFSNVTLIVDGECVGGFYVFLYIIYEDYFTLSRLSVKCSIPKEPIMSQNNNSCTVNIISDQFTCLVRSVNLLPLRLFQRIPFACLEGGEKLFNLYFLHWLLNRSGVFASVGIFCFVW